MTTTNKGATCSVPACDQLPHARTWCRIHWKRWRRTGTPHGNLSRPITDVIEDAEWLLGTDHPERIAQRLGYATVDTLRTTLRRNGRDDLAQQLTDGAA